MRVIFTSFALDAHFFGQVPLAWALRCAGHEVRVASQPALTASITSAGLTAVPVGADHGWQDAMAGPDNPDWDVTLDLDPARPQSHHPDLVRAVATEMTNRFFARANNDSMIDDLVAFARAWQPDLVIWEPFTPAGAIAAAVTGAAHARLLWGADLIVDQREALLRAPAGPDPVGDWLGAVAGRHGLVFDEELIRGQWTIDQLPSSIRLPSGEPTVPMRYVPYNGPAVVPDWLREPPRRPRVCLTIGISERHGANFVDVTLPRLLEAVADLDAEIVATLSQTARAAVALPDNVRAVDFVPLHALLPTCSAIVHHAGAGTWATAVAAGVPQLMFPSVFDNAYRARRTAELGAGLVVPAAEATASALRDGLVRLLAEPSFAEGADRLSRELLAEPAPTDVVPALEKLTFQHQGHSL